MAPILNGECLRPFLIGVFLKIEDVAWNACQSNLSGGSNPVAASKRLQLAIRMGKDKERALSPPATLEAKRNLLLHGFDQFLKMPPIELALSALMYRSQIIRIDLFDVLSVHLS